MTRLTESAWEREQRRQVNASLRLLRGTPPIGECAWTGRTDNSELGTRDLTPPDVGESELDADDYYDFYG